MKRIHPLLLVPLLSLVMAGAVCAQSSAVPSLMNYQGHVTGSDGVTAIGASTPENRLVHFKFWNHVTNSAPANLLYSESQVVTMNKGDFSVLIGEGGVVTGEEDKHTFANAFSSPDVYLGITVGVSNSSIGSNSEITPRQRIVATAFAQRAKIAEGVTAAAINATMLAPNAVQQTNIAPGAVSLASMSLGAIKGGNDADTTVGNRGSILDGSITSFDLASNSVTSDKIADGQVKKADLDTDAVDSSKIMDGTVAVADLVAAVKEALCPPGTIVAYGGTTAPAGWLLCDGKAYEVSGQFNALYLAIQGAFGLSGSQFNVPDFRGRFLRGVDGTAGRDPDKTATLRPAMNAGGNTGDAVGSIQGHALQNHTHSYTKPQISAEADDGGTSYNEVNRNEITGTTGAHSGNGSTETRPINAYVNYIIKY